MNVLNRSLTILGEIQSTEDLTIEGAVDGPVWAEDAIVVITADGRVTGDVVAREIVVFGTAKGNLIASEIVDVRPQSVVTGRVIARTFALADGATFNGAVQPQQLFAALQVARHRHAQSDGAATASLDAQSSVSDARLSALA